MMPGRYCVRAAADAECVEGLIWGRPPTSPRRGNWHAGEWRCRPWSIAELMGRLPCDRGLEPVDAVQATRAGMRTAMTEPRPKSGRIDAIQAAGAGMRPERVMGVEAAANEATDVA
jgi:hypothetical protein